ncbi:MAG: hypothetical protein AAGB13_14760 [Cyanobacteria bacterium P01_F01_bin.33]
MGIGSVLYKLREKYQHGLVTAHYRDSVRPKITNAKPLVGTSTSTCEIHVLTSARDWVNLLWTLQSFYFHSERKYALCIHDDGTLEPEQFATFSRLFPEARVIDRPTADAFLFDYLKDYPRCLEFRKTNHLAPKVFDFIAYLEGDRMLLLDSDILFFKPPQVMLDRIENPDYKLNSLNADVSSAYTVDPAIVKDKMGVEVKERVNSGLGLVHKDSLRLDWIEEFLALPDIIGHFWRIEQTLYALCSSRYGYEPLPIDYDVHLEPGLRDIPSRHYVGAIRHLMYQEGMQHLVKQGFLRAVTA